MDVAKGMAALKAEDLSAVVHLAHKKMQREGTPIKLSANEAEEALRQYYALPFLQPRQQQFAVSKTVDDYWHWHILHTEEYASFCHRVYGCMMHHGLLDPDDEPDTKRVAELYQQSRAILVHNFGDDVSPMAYPELTAANRDDVVVCVMYDVH